MKLLEEEPEKDGRWQRFAIGAGIAISIAAVLVFGANHFEPTRKLVQKVVQLTVLPEPIKKEDLPPPRTVPPPPPPKRAPPKNSAKPVAQQDAPKPVDSNPTDQTIGLDAESFGEGGDGPGFQQGNSQMGTPGTVTKAPVKEAPKAIVNAVEVPIRVLSQELPPYPSRARKLGVQGLVVLEIDVDENGKLRHARLRQGLEESLDKAALEAAKRWAYEPARLDGRPIASTRLVRLRFALEN